MSRLFLKERVKVGEIAGNSVSLEIIRVNREKRPKVAIITGIHGNEHSGLLIISRLLRKTKNFGGEISFIPFSNPLATLLNRRVGLDFLDLNRIFSGKEDGSFTERIAKILTNFLINFDLVVDLHNFENVRTPVMGIWMDSGSRSIKRKNLELLMAFSPDVIWHLVPIKREAVYSKSLGPFLCECGIPNFAVEMDSLEIIEEKDINKVENGIVRVLEFLNGNLDECAFKNKNIPILERIEVRSDNSGLFIPKRSIISKVEKGDVVGKLIDLRNFVEKEVVCKLDGLLIQISNKKLINTGDLLFSIGKRR